MLQTDADIMDPSFRSLVNSMIHDMETALNEDKSTIPTFQGQKGPQGVNANKQGWGIGMGGYSDMLKNFNIKKG